MNSAGEALYTSTANSDLVKFVFPHDMRREAVSHMLATCPSSRRADDIMRLGRKSVQYGWAGDGGLSGSVALFYEQPSSQEEG